MESLLVESGGSLAMSPTTGAQVRRITDTFLSDLTSAASRGDRLRWERLWNGGCQTSIDLAAFWFCRIKAAQARHITLASSV